MKYLVVILLLSFLSIKIKSQNSSNQCFTGSLKTSDGQTIKIKLVINEIKNNVFKGYTITNYTSNDFTKSIVEGEIDLKAKKMSFREVYNVETKSSAEVSNFCFVIASNLSIATFDNKKIIKGDFKGLYPNGKHCASGTILLLNEEILNEFVAQKNKTKNKTDDLKLIVKDTVILNKIIYHKTELLFNNWQKGVSIEIWDGSYEDNDEVAIYINDDLKYDNVILKNEKKIINLTENDNDFVVKIVALNEGIAGKNTLNFKFINVNESQEYISILDKGESFFVNFKKK